MNYGTMSVNVSDQSADFALGQWLIRSCWQCGTKETNPAVLEVVVQDTMKMKDKDGDGVLSAKEFWEFGEEDGSSHQL